MEPGTTPKPTGTHGSRRRHGKVAPKVTVDDHVVAAEVRAGLRFKGHEDYVSCRTWCAGAGYPLSARTRGKAGWADGYCAIAKQRDRSLRA
jgi:outer membrane cobalamin receptor